MHSCQSTFSPPDLQHSHEQAKGKMFTYTDSEPWFALPEPLDNLSAESPSRSVHQNHSLRHGWVFVAEVGFFVAGSFFNAGLFMGVFQKSILNRVCQLLSICAHKMAPRTSQGLQEPAWDAPT
jgi:hypothetical protein